MASPVRRNVERTASTFHNRTPPSAHVAMEAHTAGEYFPLEGSANPLPQALILTAIVIGFALFSFLLVLGYRAYQELDADNTDNMRVAEPENAPRPPLSY